jgi:hypothetical protein
MFWHPTVTQLYVSTPLRQYFSTPLRQYAITSVRQYVSTLVRQYVSTPVRQYVSTPIRQYVSTPVRQYPNGVQVKNWIFPFPILKSQFPNITRNFILFVARGFMSRTPTKNSLPPTSALTLEVRRAAEIISLKERQFADPHKSSHLHSHVNRQFGYERAFCQNVVSTKFACLRVFVEI